HGVTDHQQEIDSIISDHLEKWTLNRIASVERSILRIATFEIKFLDDIPNSVSINEAIELANKFGDEKSGKFVNAVLSKIIS
ncbi:transcription antitermination factor NusB, partial [Bacillus obstructivus]